MRYMDAQNENDFASEDALKYWESVDLYIGGSEHATGHLLYSRFWNKFLKDRGYAPTEEPFKKLINQGMILGMSAYVYRWEYGISEGENRKVIFISKSLIDKSIKAETMLINDIEILNNIIGNQLILSSKTQMSHFTPIHVDLSCINDITNELDIVKFKSHPLYTDYKDAEFIPEEDGKYIVGREVEKMSKSKYNVVSPDDICDEYGADTLRLYEMFLGPLEQSKPWNTAGITGVSGFLKKLWKLYHSGENDSFYVSDSPPSEGLGEAYKSLHKTIKKVTEDIENFSFNTSVSQFMICVNELQQLKCNHRAILDPLAILVSPYAPHIAEELWSALGHEGSIATVAFPKFEEKYLVESEKEYPVSFNGKMRFTIKLPLDLTAAQIEEIVMADERTQTQLQGRTPNKVIIVPGKIINLVG
jgi:leucyl-tRNA synthetase